MSNFRLVLLVLAVGLSFRAAHAADWEDEEDSSRLTRSTTHARNYPGGGDEDDLTVQAHLPESGRYPESAVHAEAKPVDPDAADTPND